MANTDTQRMDADERAAFLGTGGTGVLSVPTDEPAPYSRPVSYGYDATDGVFYFRLALGSDRERSDLAGRTVSFVTYDHTDAGWCSAIATGPLEETTEESIAIETLQGLERTHIPLVDIFGTPPKEVSFGFYRLVPTDLTIRTEGRTEV